MPQNIDKLAMDAFDEQKVMPHCEEHMYFAKNPTTFPQHSCKACWMAYYLLIIGRSSSAENRGEKVDQLEAIVHKQAEQIGRGEDPGRLRDAPVLDISKHN